MPKTRRQELLDDARYTQIGVAGEVNTASNIGTDGVGVFDGKVGLYLQFRHVAPASSKVTVVENGDDIDIDVDESNLDHDNITNGDDEHHVHVGTSAPGVLVNGQIWVDTSGSKVTLKIYDSVAGDWGRIWSSG